MLLKFLNHEKCRLFEVSTGQTQPSQTLIRTAVVSGSQWQLAFTKWTWSLYRYFQYKFTARSKLRRVFYITSL